MPIYEYQCTSCGHEMEVIQKMSDEPLRDCPSCGGSTLSKKVSAPVFRLKGAGWYETDFKSGNKKQLADAESAKEGGGDKADQGADAQKGAKEAAEPSKSNSAAKTSEATPKSKAQSSTKSSDTGGATKSG